MSWLSLVAICFAGWRSRFVPSLFQYFYFMALANIAGRSVAFFFGDTSLIYAIAYSILTGLILLAVIKIAVDNLLNVQYSYHGAVIAAVVAMTLVHLAYSGIAAPVGFRAWIQLVEAVVLLWAGLCAVGTAPYMENWGIYMTLGVLWLVQAGFRLGFLLNAPSWLYYNWRVPPVLCIVAFVIIGRLAGKAFCGTSPLGDFRES